MDVGIRVLAENHRTRVQRHVMSCFFIMVSMTDEGQPTEVPRFVPETEDDVRRWKESERRHELRLAAKRG